MFGQHVVIYTNRHLKQHTKLVTRPHRRALPTRRTAVLVVEPEWQLKAGYMIRRNVARPSSTSAARHVDFLLSRIIIDMDNSQGLSLPESLPDTNAPPCLPRIPGIHAMRPAAPTRIMPCSTAGGIAHFSAEAATAILIVADTGRATSEDLFR